MTQSAMRLLGLMLVAFAAGCADPSRELMTPHDAIMQGSANGVVISYYGDLSKTLPLAQQYCARYERVPVFLSTKENNAYYYCVRAGEGPQKTS